MDTSSPSKKHHEVRNWFYDEGSQTGKKAKVDKNGKVKVYCIKCFDETLERLIESDEQSGVECTNLDRHKQSA